MKNAYNTSAYGSFAYVYDIFMDKIYGLEHVEQYLKEDKAV